MKFKSFILLIVFGILILGGGFGITQKINAATLTVGAGQTIAAVASSTNNGDIVVVSSTYNPNLESFPLNINKQITLDCVGNSIISPNSISVLNKAVKINTSSVTVKNCNFVNTRLILSRPHYNSIIYNNFNYTFSSTTEDIYDHGSIIKVDGNYHFVDLLIASNTIRMKEIPETWGVAHQGENYGIYVNYQTNDNFNSNVIINNNKIDAGDMAGGGGNGCVKIFSDNSPSSSLRALLYHNTCISPAYFSGDEQKGMVLLSYSTSTGFLDVGMDYNIFSNSATTSSNNAIGIYYAVNFGGKANVSGNYNGYYNYETDFEKHEDISGNASGLGGLGPNDLSTNPLFKTSRTGNESDFVLAPISSYIDVTSTIDLGAIEASRPNKFLVGDKTWYDILTGTTTVLYSTSTVFGTIASSSDQVKTNSVWTFVGENPVDFLENYLRSNDEVAIFPGSYGPVNITKPVSGVAIGNYAWGAYLLAQVDSKMWSLILAEAKQANYFNYTGDYSCRDAWKAVMNNHLDGSSGPTFWEQVQDTCSKLGSLNGVQATICGSVDAYVDYICAVPDTNDKVIFNATSNKNAFTADGMVSSSIFGIDFNNASSSFINAYSGYHYYEKNSLDSATMTPHVYSLNSVNYDHTNDPTATNSISILNSTGLHTISAAKPSNITSAINGLIDYDLLLITADTGLMSHSATSSVTTTITLYFNKDQVLDSYGDSDVNSDNLAEKIATQFGGTVDCYVPNIFVYSDSSKNYIYNNPVSACPGLTVSGTPAITVSTSNHNYDLVPQNGSIGSGVLFISDFSQLGGGSSSGNAITADFSDVTDLIGEPPQNWDLAMATIDSGAFTGSGNTGVAVNLSIYFRDDMFATSGAKIAFRNNVISKNLKATIDCWADNVFTYSNGNYIYNNPSSQCLGVTVTGTPKITLSRSGYAGIKLSNSHGNDFYGNDFKNNAFGIWLDGNSYDNMFVGSVTNNIASEDNLITSNNYNGDFFSTSTLRDSASMLYIYSSSTFYNLLFGNFVSPFSDSFMSVDVPSTIVNSSLADIYVTASTTSGHNSFYNVGADLNKVITNSTVPTNIYYRARVHGIDNNSKSLSNTAATLKSANNSNVFTGTTDSNGYTDYSNNFLAASLYLPNNTSSTSGGYNPYTAAISNYSNSVNLVNANQTIDTYTGNNNNSNGGAGYGANNTIVAPTVKVPPYIKSFNTKTGQVTIYAEVQKAASMAISFDIDFSGISWEKYTTTTDRNLTGTYGEKKIYVKYRTSLGGTSPIYTITVNWTKTSIETTTSTTVVTTNNQDTKVEQPVTTTITPPQNQIYLFKHTLKLGSTGDDVRALQQILREAKYFNYYKNTGYFGTATKSALIKYQTAKGLKATGVLDNATLEVLNG